MCDDEYTRQKIANSCVAIRPVFFFSHDVNRSGNLLILSINRYYRLCAFLDMREPEDTMIRYVRTGQTSWGRTNSLNLFARIQVYNVCMSH